MDEIIKKIAFFTPDTPDEMPSCGDTSFNQDDSCSSCDAATDHDHSDLQNYMFFRNLKAMRDHIDHILGMDAQSIDQKLTEHHDWATDHIASAHENLEQVFGWLSADENHTSACESTHRTKTIVEDQCPVCGTGHISGNSKCYSRSDRPEDSDDYDDVDDLQDELDGFDNELDSYDEDEDLDDLYGGYR